MKWLKTLFSRDSDASRFHTRPADRLGRLTMDVERARSMFVELARLYPADSVILRQQRDYVATVERELSAVLAVEGRS